MKPREIPRNPTLPFLQSIIGHRREDDQGGGFCGLPAELPRVFPPTLLNER